MNKRMLDGGIWANEKFSELPAMARLLQIGIINLADDQGRIKAHPAYLRSQIFPYEDVAIEDVRAWLHLIAANSTAFLYEADGKEYVQLINWWEYQSLQFAAPSEYPRPCGWGDRIRYNAKGGAILTNNWHKSDGTPLPDTCNAHGDPSAPSTPDNPPGGTGGNPGGQPPDNPPGGTNKDQDQDQIKLLPRAREDNWQTVVDTFQKEIGVLTESIGEEMKAYYDEVGASLMVDAIREASRNNIRKWSYVDGILRRWKANGRRAPDGGNSWAQLADNLPDYMKEH